MHPSRLRRPADPSRWAETNKTILDSKMIRSLKIIFYAEFNKNLIGILFIVISGMINSLLFNFSISTLEIGYKKSGKLAISLVECLWNINNSGIIYFIEALLIIAFSLLEIKKPKMGTFSFLVFIVLFIQFMLYSVSYNSMPFK